MPEPGKKSTSDAIEAIVEELAEWDQKGFPLGGGNVINIFVRNGLLTVETAERIYRRVAAKYESEFWQPALTTDVGPIGPAHEWLQKADDEIPF